MNTLNLTARLREIFDRVRREAVEGGRPVRDLLLAEEVTRRDRAAVADAFTPGAGSDYLR